MSVDAKALLATFKTGSYQVSRRPSGTFADGLPVQQPAELLSSIDAFVHPATGRELLRLPEGRRAFETRAVFTLTLLNTGGQGEPYEADRIILEDGLQWEVQHVERWPAQQLLYRALVQRPR